jgi:multidrug efflux pump subunit AcrB
LGSAYFPIKTISTDDEGNNNIERIWLNYDIQGNYSLEEVEQTVHKMEAFLYDNKEEFYITQVYSWFQAGEAVSGITLEPDLPIKVSELKKRIKEKFPKFARAKPSFQWNQGNSGGVRITLTGQASDTLLKLADDLIPLIASIEGLTDVKTDTASMKQELQIRIDRQKAFRFGLNANGVADQVATALRGANLRTFRNDETGEIDVRLMFDEKLQSSLNELANLTLKRDSTYNVTLDMVAEMKIVPSLSEIRRNYRQTAISIGANLQDDLTMGEARKRIEQLLSHVQLPSGYSWSLDGGFVHLDEANAVMLVNMLLAICIIYVVMAALFESLLLPTAVITSLFFSFVGVCWSLWVTNTPLSLMVLIGCLILMGIVVNNGIVLVYRINQLVNEGLTVHEAIVQSCVTRVRPILMTVATTALGLIPLAVGNTEIGGDGPPYSPMAISIIGGLLFSTLTSLFLVPFAYLQLLKLRRNTAKMIQDSKLLVARVIKV